MAGTTRFPPTGSTPVGNEAHTFGRAGQRYWCAYWCELFDVLSVNPDRSVTVRWCADGRVTTHRTWLDRRDHHVGPTPNQPTTNAQEAMR